MVTTTTNSGTKTVPNTITTTSTSSVATGTATRESATATQTATTTGTQTSTSTYSSTYTDPDGVAGNTVTLIKYDNEIVNTDVIVIDLEGGVPAVEEYVIYEEIVLQNQEVVGTSRPVQVEIEVEQTSVVTSTATRLK
jgi:hypothetical protein